MNTHNGVTTMTKLPTPDVKLLVDLDGFDSDQFTVRDLRTTRALYTNGNINDDDYLAIMMHAHDHPRNTCVRAIALAQIAEIKMTPTLNARDRASLDEFIISNMEAEVINLDNFPLPGDTEH